MSSICFLAMTALFTLHILYLLLLFSFLLRYPEGYLRDCCKLFYLWLLYSWGRQNHVKLSCSLGIKLLPSFREAGHTRPVKCANWGTISSESPTLNIRSFTSFFQSFHNILDISYHVTYSVFSNVILTHHYRIYFF